MLGAYPAEMTFRQSSRSFQFVLAILAIVASLMVVRFYGPSLIDTYWRGPAGRETRQRLGFELQYIPSSIPGREEIYAFTKIVPGSPFAKSGVEAGDTFERWLGYPAHIDSMYKWFSEARGQEIQLRLVNIRYGNQWPAHLKTVTVAVPR